MIKIYAIASSCAPDRLFSTFSRNFIVLKASGVRKIRAEWEWQIQFHFIKHVTSESCRLRRWRQKRLAKGERCENCVGFWFQITCKASRLPSIFPAISPRIRFWNHSHHQKIAFVSAPPPSSCLCCHPVSWSLFLAALFVHLRMEIKAHCGIIADWIEVVWSEKRAGEDNWWKLSINLI